MCFTYIVALIKNHKKSTLSLKHDEKCKHNIMISKWLKNLRTDKVNYRLGIWDSSQEM